MVFWYEFLLTIAVLFTALGRLVGGRADFALTLCAAIFAGVDVLLLIAEAGHW